MNWGGGGRSPSLTSLFSSVKGSLFSYFKSQFLILKKSFTLVELSIVLLVLALLVSTLLVGRQIIDRAKVQQVISEIDYYTKNFQMFKDQYDFLPGGLGEETCRKYPEFSMQKGDDTTQYQSQCDDPVSMLGGSATKYYTSYKQANFSMVDMVNSGMVENRSPGERRRKKFDIAEQEETTCIDIPAVQGKMYTFKPTDAVAEMDIKRYMLNNGLKNIFAFRVYKEGQNNTEIQSYDSCPNNAFITLDCLSSKLNGINGGVSWYKFYSTNCNVNTGEGSFVVLDYNVSCTGYSYKNYVNGENTMMYLTPYGINVHKNDKKHVCETKTIPGVPRFGYLLKQDEIENQANKSSFDSKTWISYTGEKVDKAMIYGIGDNNPFSGGNGENIIVFFHYDKDKTELNDDGAVSYDLYDLIVKKLGEKEKESIGNIIPFTKSGGQGFNFAYVMR